MSSPCVTPLNFPAVIANRPGLARIEYRIGRYSDFRASMLDALDKSLVLRQWTHRTPDDPGIALLEGAAILGDILTFYQELYANEAWLRTATWEESVTNIVRLIGYRPAPGVGGIGKIAFTISGDSSVNIPAGLPLSAQLGGMPQPTNFETAASLEATPGLSSMRMYAPTMVPPVYHGSLRIAAQAANLAAANVTLKPNDRLMLVDNATPGNHQITVVHSVETILDQTVLTLAGTWQWPDAVSGMTAYKLGNTFRAFGYNAPDQQFSADSAGKLVSTPIDTMLSVKNILQGFPLERQANNLSAGITMLVEMKIWHSFSKTDFNYFESHVALTVKSDTDTVGPMHGGITRVAFYGKISGPSYSHFYADRRTAICHEVVGQGFAVGGMRQKDAAAKTSALDFLGTGSDYEALNGRLLQFVSLKTDGTADRVEEARATIDRREVSDPRATKLRRITLAPALSEFTWADFPPTAPTVTVLGNVLPITEGKTQSIAVLGNGDARQIFQSFQLPKAPLTRLLDEAMSPPLSPQITILVSNIAWTPVDSFFPCGPRDQVYILREDHDGTTWAQFGDGINGARLVSGVNNVIATYRTGVGANGWLQSGAKAQANAKVANLDKVLLYDEITGGAEVEDGAHVKQSAPGRVERLNRLVSLVDYEFEALSLPGVQKALAAWDVEDNIPLLRLTVLLADNTAAQLSTVQAAMSAANVDRGADRFTVLVTPAALEYVQLRLRIGLVAGHQPQIVIASVRQALGVLPSDGSAAPEDGLFSLARRTLGEAEYASRIEGTAQNVPGVAWAEVVALSPLGLAQYSHFLLLPWMHLRQAAVACAGNRVLALQDKDCHVTAGAA